ncbi:uncharacterized protein I206_107163 [Kwoniella pini CBS 10737]|uniref:Uncharacterized protein n=1 Tax=Kwoniella pini CBS 10737 TaxID=1296096 RepID=A0A1B9HZ06_9TREE|nr:uncharacterized protein I206_05291 [Kwoniella pini CBS 10737]OCF48512.1 hypothetical protein I206_05291 [Kwoniella pini CBS 10737]
MSFLRATSTLPLSRASYRALSTSSIRSKSLTESVKDAADAVNKKVGQTLASGLESAQTATEQAKGTVNEKTPSQSEIDSKASSVAQGAKETAESARQNANQALGSAAGKARDAADEVNKRV